MDLEWNGVVLTISDRVSKGEAEDRSGPILAEGLKANGAGWVVQDKCSVDGAKVRSIVEHWEIRDADLLLLIGGLFIVETGSVILQRAYFKATKGKRIFLMTPIHHHFELKGWQEVTIVVRFWIIAGLFVVTGVGAFYGEWLLRQ